MSHVSKQVNKESKTVVSRHIPKILLQKSKTNIIFVNYTGYAKR